MKPFFVAALCFLSTMAVAQTTDFYITAPLPGTVYKAGQSATLTWLNGVDTEVDVNLLVGNDPATMVNSAYSFTIPDGSDEEFTVVIPADLDSTKSYAFQFSYLSNGATKNVFSGSFVVTGGKTPIASGSGSGSAAQSASVTVAPSLPASVVPTAVSSRASVAAPSAISAPSSAVSHASTPVSSASPKIASSPAPSASVSAPAEGAASKMHYTLALVCAPVILAMLL
ncbi:hypothetical protein F4703DRAFT_1821499 [Phycomyces blakesleeanus]